MLVFLAMYRPLSAARLSAVSWSVCLQRSVLSVGRIFHTAAYSFKWEQNDSSSLDNALIDETLEDSHDDILERWRGNISNRQNIFVIQPEFKWGRQRFKTKLSKHRVEEAVGMIQAIPGWSFDGSTIESVHDYHQGTFFGSGKLKELGSSLHERVGERGVTAVFLNTGNLNKRQTRELERELGCRVFDRYRVVLEIFKERAHSKTAKLQVQLAELHYLRSHVGSESSPQEHPRGRMTAISGVAESLHDKDKRRIAAKSEKIKNELQKIKSQRRHTREEREQKHVPQVAVLGYTNAGKTTLAKTLSKDAKLEPEDQLFATVDSTAHRGKLPSGCNVVYIDTVGFISDLPHGLIGSFSATLDDVVNANLLVHVRDMSHPERDLQKQTVLDVLGMLNIHPKLTESMIEVQNKMDLSDDVAPVDADHKNVFPISALQSTGIEPLSNCIESSIFRLTGRRLVSIIVDPASDQLSWLHKEAVVVSCNSSNDGILHVNAIMDSTMVNKYKAKFGSNVL